MQEAAATAAAEAQASLCAAQAATTAAETASADSLAAAAAKATEEYDNLRRVLDAVNAQKADLEAKLAKAGGALNAADELKEARWMFHLTPVNFHYSVHRFMSALGAPHTSQCMCGAPAMPPASIVAHPLVLSR